MRLCCEFTTLLAKDGGDHHVELLHGLWNSARLGSIEEPPGFFDSMDPNFDPLLVLTKDVGSVPSCIDNTPPSSYLGYCGVSFFQRGSISTLQMQELAFSFKPACYIAACGSMRMGLEIIELVAT
jgi:hypothetical protein